MWGKMPNSLTVRLRREAREERRIFMKAIWDQKKRRYKLVDPIYRFERLEEADLSKYSDGVYNLYPYNKDTVDTLELTNADFAKVAEAARAFGKICVAKIGNWYVTDPLPNGTSRRLVLFNACNCRAEEAEFRVILRNTGRGALTEFWWDEFVRLDVGSVL